MDEGFARINEICWGFRESRVLEIACRIGLFGALEGDFGTVKEICKKCGTTERHTEKLLIACCGLGLVRRDGDAFCNAEISSKYLVPSSEYYQGDIILHSASVRENFDRFEEEIFVEPKKETEAEQWDHFIRGMNNIASCGRLKLFLESVDLSNKKKMLDVGGGPGSYCIGACENNHNLKAVVWDLPETVKIAKEYIAKAGLQERINVVEGDWNTDSFGEGYDLVVMSNVLHGTEWECKEKLLKAYDALVDGGTLAVQEFLLNDEKDGSLIPSLFNVMVGAYSKGELLGVIKEAGFEDVKVTGENPEIGSWWVTGRKAISNCLFGLEVGITIPTPCVKLGNSFCG